MDSGPVPSAVGAAVLCCACVLCAVLCCALHLLRVHSTTMAKASGKESVPAKKKARRSSRHETASPSHYGPVACTSAAAALVQAYLAVDHVAAAAAATTTTAATDPTTNDSGRKGASSSSTPQAAAPDSSSCFLYMSESRFDPVKRRFGGKSKPVSMASLPGDATGRGFRLSFGTTAKIVATKEAMHTALHCRCVFVLLREVSSEGIAKSSSSSSQGEGRPATERSSASRSRRTDTAHLIALSPDDLFLALSVDSFPLAVSIEGEGSSRGGTPTGGSGGGGGGGGGGTRGSNNSYSKRRSHSPAAGSTLSRAFEVIDGPVIIHRPPSRVGEPWRGLEVYRPEAAPPHDDGKTRPWRGQRLPLPPGLWQGQGQGHRDETRGQGGGSGLVPCTVFGGGSGSSGSGGVGGVSDGNGGGSGIGSLSGGVSHDKTFCLDLSTPTNFGLTPPAPNGDAARFKKRAAGTGAGAGGALLVAPPSASPLASIHPDIAACGGFGRRRTALFGKGGYLSAVVALPAAAGGGAAAGAGGSSTAVAAAAEASVTTLPTPNWMSLSDDQEGRTSLSPWGGAPRGLLNSFTCLCRAPEVDAGVVTLAGASPRGAAGGGLVLRPLPPTVYVGATAVAAAAVTAGGGIDGGRINVDRDGGGVLLELQGEGTLSCSRSLPAPPWAVMTAAVDDAQGVLVVLLADAAGTALLLARDGSGFPVVEEYRAVAAAFAGDFLDNGREQVALLPTVAAAAHAGPGSGGGGGAASPGGRRAVAATTAANRVGAGCIGGGWEQLPLKTLVKRAIVTDCSSVWGNGRRDDLAARPGTGPIQVVGARPNGAEGGGGAASGASGGAAVAETAARVPEAMKGKKRHRPSGENDDDAADGGGGGGGGSGGGKVGSANVSGKVGPSVGGSLGPSKRSNGGSEEGHRLDNLSTVVDVLRRRVQAEEARLLRLQLARRGKAAALEAAKLALSVQVGSDMGSAGGNCLLDPPPWLARSTARAFYDGQTVPGGASTVSTPRWIDEAPTETAASPLRCAIARVRFHAPSRTLCVDALVSNSSLRPTATDTPVDGSSPAAESAASVATAATTAAAAVPAAVTNVCLAASSVSGRLTTRSAVCPRLGPGESATVRACIDVPLDFLVAGGDGGGGGGGGGVKSGEAAALLVSCMWGCSSDTDFDVAEGRTKGPPTAGRAKAVVAAAAAAGVETRSIGADAPRSIIFARVLVSAWDMLGIGLLSSAGEAPPLTTSEVNIGGETSCISTNSRVELRNGGMLARRTSSRKTCDGGGGGGGGGGRDAGGGGGDGSGIDRQHHLGLFNVGTRLDLLLRSDTSGRLTSLPQAVRSLSAVASLPEPWAGGAAVTVGGCSERAAECILRAGGGDSPGASAVLLAVATGALPDGVRASVDHASRQGRELVVAAASAIGDETAALEAVARARRRVGGKSLPPLGMAGVGVGVGGVGGRSGDGQGVGAGGGLAEALRRYAAAQMKTDVLVAQVVGRIAAVATVGAGDGEGDRPGCF